MTVKLRLFPVETYTQEPSDFAGVGEFGSEWFEAQRTEWERVDALQSATQPMRIDAPASVSYPWPKERIQKAEADEWEECALLSWGTVDGWTRPGRRQYAFLGTRYGPGLHAIGFAPAAIPPDAMLAHWARRGHLPYVLLLAERLSAHGVNS